MEEKEIFKEGILNKGKTQRGRGEEIGQEVSEGRRGRDGERDDDPTGGKWTTGDIILKKA